MIGNDIVDLRAAWQQSNWRRPGWMSKVFTPLEQSWVHAADEPDQWVWMLWSAKESAYKLCRRKSMLRVFAPKQLGVQKWTQTGWREYQIVIQTPQGALSVISEFCSEYVHSVASELDTSAFQQMIIPVAATYPEQSQMLKTKACAALARIHGEFSAGSYQIIKDEDGLPWIWGDDQRLDLMVSLSHHGEYGAVVWRYSL